MIGIPWGAYRYSSLHMVFWIIYLLLLIAFSLNGLGKRPPIAGGDKLMHFAAYLVLGYLYPRPLLTIRHAVVVCLVLVGMGGFLEFVQWAFVRAGIGDPLDALANALGVACGLVIVFWTANWRGNGKQDI